MPAQIIAQADPASSFEIKIDFEKHSEQPRRVFQAMAQMIESFHLIDNDLLLPFDIRAETFLILEDITPLLPCFARGRGQHRGQFFGPTSGVLPRRAMARESLQRGPALLLSIPRAQCVFRPGTLAPARGSFAMRSTRQQRGRLAWRRARSGYSSASRGPADCFRWSAGDEEGRAPGARVRAGRRWPVRGRSGRNPARADRPG